MMYFDIKTNELTETSLLKSDPFKFHFRVISSFHVLKFLVLFDNLNCCIYFSKFKFKFFIHN